MNSSPFQTRFHKQSYDSRTLASPTLHQYKSKPSFYSRQQTPKRDYSPLIIQRRDRSPINKQIHGIIIKNDSCKNLSLARRNSNFLQSKPHHYCNTEKTIKAGPLDVKTSTLYQTSSTMKQIQNCDPSIKSTFVPYRKKSTNIKDISFAQRKLGGDWLDVIRPIGKGKYGKVFLVRDKQTDFIMALKAIQKKKLRQSNLLQQFIRQIKIQFFLDHPGIVKLFGFFDDTQNFYLLMELGCDGQLYDKISGQRILAEQSASFVARNMLQVVDYMHSERVLHRDIKPENIVLILGHLKICDFGWAVYNNTEMRSTFCGTPLYFSPQLVSGQQYDEKIDLWAIGVMIFQLVTGVSPFNLKQPQDLRKIVTNQVQFPKSSKVSYYFKNFIQVILQKNPQKRPTSKQLLETHFIKHYKQFQICEQLCKNHNSSYQKRLYENKYNAKSVGKSKCNTKYQY